MQYDLIQFEDFHIEFTVLKYQTHSQVWTHFEEVEYIGLKISQNSHRVKPES